MTTGDLLLIGGALAAFGAAVARVSAMRSGDRRMTSASTILSMFAFLFVSLALLLLTYYFLASDFGTGYVWSYSSSDLSTVYKLSGVWAGSSGSFLLWTWFMALVLIIEVALEPRRSYLTSKFHGIFQTVLSSVVFLFLLILMGMSLFKPTGTLELQYYPNGNGLKLVLQTPEMIFHPPVVFAGYAFCVAAFAAGAAYFFTSDRNWTAISLPWARLSWLFLTLGIGIGAIWAYYVLGWGGYWGWDPVETSSLLPWLLVTTFLHTQIRHARKGEYGIVSPMLGMLSFVAVLFATFATRAGGIWTSSVHSFGSSQGASAGARLSYLLQNDNSVLGIFSIMVIFLVFAFFMAYSKYRSAPHQEEQPEPDKISEYIGDKNNMLLAVVLLIATSAIMLLLLFKNVDVSQSANYAEFNQKMSIFFVALMVTMTICLLWKYLGKEVTLWLSVGMVASSIAFSIVAGVTGSLDWLVAFSLPSYLVAVGSSAVKLVKSGAVGTLRTRVQKVSPHIIHLAVAIVLMSFIVSTSLQQEANGSGRVVTSAGVVVNLGDELGVGDYTIRLVSLTARNEQSFAGGTLVTVVRDAVIDIARSGETLREDVTLSDMYGPSIKGGLEVVHIEVYIYKSIIRDLYINFQWRDNSSALIEAKTVPLMNTLWLGLGLLAVGIVLRTSSWHQEIVETQSKAVKASSKKSGKDYEALVEEELKKYKAKRGR